jgi:hypothetical protein
VRTNRIIDPATTSVSTWSAAGGTRDIVGGKLRVTPGGTSGCYVYGNPTAAYATSGRHNISPGDNYALRCEVTNPTSTPNYVRWGAVFYTSTGAQSTAPGNLSPVMTVGPGETVLVELFGTLPATATTTTGLLPLLYTYSTAAGAVATVDNVTDSTRWQLEVGPTAPTADPIDFFYGGDSSIFTAWAGAANASPSTYVQTMPALDVDADAWQIGIRFSELLAATSTMTVTAITPEGEYPVRGADRAYAVGGFTTTDFEAPPGVPVTYRGRMFAANGTELGYTEATTAQYDIDPSMVVLSDPLVPGNAVMVEAKATFGQRKVRKRLGSTFRVGSRTIGLYAPLGMLEGVDLAIQTQELNAADELELVLEAMPVLVRSMPAVRVPRQLYVAIESVEAADVDVQYGGEWTVYPLEGNQVSRSVTDIVVPIVTWQTYLDAFPTWSAFNAAYATWLDAMQNPPKDENARSGR